MSVYRTIGPLVLVLLVVCNVGICVFCPYSFVFFRVSFLLLWAPLAAYNNLIDSISVISLYMPAQLRGSCGHLKGKYDSHSSLIVLVVLGTIPVSSANRGLILFGS